MNAMKCGALALALSAIGCSSLPKMSWGSPIDIDTSPGFAPRYTQFGARIDVADMADQIEKEPNAVSDVSTARAMSVLSAILSSAGGALIGWPLGEAAGGDRDPLWPLAGAGAGVGDV
jgi:hypothetical protein